MDSVWFKLPAFIAAMLLLNGLTRWAHRSASRSRSEPGQLRQHVSLLIFWLLCFASFVAIIVLFGPSLRYPEVLAFAFFGILALLCLWGCLTYRTDHWAFDETQFEYPTTFGQRRTMRWDDVANVDRDIHSDWLVFEDRAGAKARPHLLLVGLAAFAETALKSCPPEALDAFDDRTRVALRAVAAR